MRQEMKSWFARFSVLLLVGCVHISFGQQADTVNLSSPYFTVYTHLEFLQEDDYHPDMAGVTLNPDVVTGEEAQKLAIKLKQVLDGTGLLLLCLSFHRYFHAHCSSELAVFIPPHLPLPCCIRLFCFAHPYSIQTPKARVNQYLCFFHFYHWSALEPQSCVCISSFL